MALTLLGNVLGPLDLTLSRPSWLVGMMIIAPPAWPPSFWAIYKV